MILFVDTGNTRIKWARYKHDALDIYEGCNYSNNKAKLSKILKPKLETLKQQQKL